MEEKIIEAIACDLREKDIATTNTLAECFEKSAGLDVIRIISAKGVIISDIRRKLMEDKTIQKPFAYLEYLKQLHTVAWEQFTESAASRAEWQKADLHYSQTEIIAQLMADAKYIMNDVVEEYLTAV